MHLYIDLGHVDPGEHDEMVTALRETKEESGLEEKDFKIFPDTKQILNYNVCGRPKSVIYWLAQLTNPSARVTLSDEHQDYKWLAFDDACQYGQYDDMKNLIKGYDDYIKSNVK